MSRLVRAVSAVAVLALLMPATPTAASPSEQALLARLGDARIERHDDTGRVRFVGAAAGATLPRGAGVGSSTRPEIAARGFVAEYGPLFGLTAASEMAVSRVREHGSFRAVRLQQLHGGVPVFAGELVVDLAANGAPASVSGEVSPALSVDVRPSVQARDAREAALTVTARSHPEAAALHATQPALRVYDHRLVGAPGAGRSRLVWLVEVTGRASDGVRELVLVDAVTGGIALHFNRVAHAKERHVCDNNNVPAANATCLGSEVRGEGGPATGTADVDNAYDYSGATYDYYSSLFARDSIDDAGMPLRSIVRFCDSAVPSCPYPNAFWNGQVMVYGQGFAAADDVVAHELTHGVTEHESGLQYIYQSGAINESLSDVFGELIDQATVGASDTSSVAWLMGEDVPGFGAIRNMQNPTALGQPDRMRSSLYDADLTFEDNGGVHTNSGVGNKAAYLMAVGGTFNGRTVTALGNEKTARIWYRAATTLLTSGSDYADLGTALPAACRALVGTSGITAADCTETSDAVLATEMALQPTVVGAAAPEAPICSSGHTTASLYFDNFEDYPASAEWTRETAAGSNQWFRGTGYATSGTFHLFGYNEGVRTDSTIRRTGGTTIPAGKTYARFRHYYNFESDGPTAYDGGIVEYSANGGPWTDAKALFSGNGYSGTITTAYDNPLEGRSAFVGWTQGYISSRIDVSSLAGMSVRFRFRLATDSEIAWDGWYIDDFSIYRCLPVADLQLTAAVDSPDPVLVGNQLTYTLTARNGGTLAAPSVVARVVLPTSVSYLGVPSGCTISGATAYGGRTIGGTVACAVGTLAAGASVTRAVTVGVFRNGALAATGSVAGGVSDPVPGNNALAMTTTASYVTGQTSQCTVLGSAAADTLAGSSSANVLCGFGGNDTMTGNGGNDVVNGGVGADRAGYASAPSGVIVNLGTKKSSCYPATSTTCAQGSDTFVSVEGAVGTNYVDRLLGSTGIDALYGLGGNDYAYGYAGNDAVDGGLGNDTLYGGDGNDSLYGQAGNDRLYGENHNDYLNGGTGTADTCSQGSGTGTVTGCP